MYLCTLVLSFTCCPMFLDIEFSAKKLIFACFCSERKSEKSQGTSFSKLAGNPVQNLNCDHEKSLKSTGKKAYEKVWEPCLYKGILVNVIKHVPEYLSIT